MRAAASKASPNVGELPTGQAVLVYGSSRAAPGAPRATRARDARAPRLDDGTKRARCVDPILGVDFGWVTLRLLVAREKAPAKAPPTGPGDAKQAAATAATAAKVPRPRQWAPPPRQRRPAAEKKARQGWGRGFFDGKAPPAPAPDDAPPPPPPDDGAAMSDTARRVRGCVEFKSSTRLQCEGRVDQARAKGAKYYEAGRYFEAVRAYSEGLDACGFGQGKFAVAGAAAVFGRTAASLLGNRSAALMMVCRFADCVRDCTHALAVAGAGGDRAATARLLAPGARSRASGASRRRRRRAPRRLDPRRWCEDALGELDKVLADAGACVAARELKMAALGRLKRWDEAVAFGGDPRGPWLERGAGGLRQRARSTDERCSTRPLGDASWWRAVARGGRFDQRERTSKLLRRSKNEGDAASRRAASCRARPTGYAGPADGKAPAFYNWGLTFMALKRYADATRLWLRLESQAHYPKAPLAAVLREPGRFDDAGPPCTASTPEAPKMDAAAADEPARRARARHAQSHHDHARCDRAAHRAGTRRCRWPRALPAPARSGAARAGTHYATLGVNYEATPAQLKKKFRELALKFHPMQQTPDR
ncbi:hypothetical protein JL721_12694 [Aureococcus anophagefferens]|nr:hypothetical protein JL721_12694 [Aureococcus anophagefferens]